jgi:hypothetical protein
VLTNGAAFGLRYREGVESKTMGRRRRSSGFRYNRRTAFQIGRVAMAAFVILVLALILVLLLR